MFGMSDYVPASLAIEAMRDNGYRNTAYAVAELIDNSIQAEATQIEILCSEKEDFVLARSVRRISSIAVLDNGKGMDEEVLRMSLQFGNGTRLDRNSRTGIGRFGMGLPASSISQCKRVGVWSWQNGIANAKYTYLDVDEIKKGTRTTVPEPILKKVPQQWLKVASKIGENGTLIVWEKLDRLFWNKATTLFTNSELLIGRIYRKFLDEKTDTSRNVKITMTAFDENDPSAISCHKILKSNDPGYLMENTSCPAPYDNQSMFEPFGDEHEVKFTINFQGENHEITLRMSVAKKEARTNDLAGSTPYGKHAKKNVGVSIIRADRELELDQSAVIQYDPRERWWGLELEFPPKLDELMGVTNNKQFARNFSDLLSNDFESMTIPGGPSISQIFANLKEEGDPRAPLFDVIIHIRNQLNSMRSLIKEQRVNTRNKRVQRHSAEVKATQETARRKEEEGFSGTSDAQEEKPVEEKKDEIIKDLIETGVDEETAEMLTAQTVDNSLKYLFVEAAIEGDAFFTVRPKGGVINVILNTRHPAYENLVEVLEKETECEDAKELSNRLDKASEGLKLLLMAWARYEDEQPDGILKERVQNSRSDWGRVARGFLRGY